jgi:hypothetical protein
MYEANQPCARAVWRSLDIHLRLDSAALTASSSQLTPCLQNASRLWLNESD